MVDALRRWFSKQIEQGLSPRAVGDQVLAAIRDDRFYILTHPESIPAIERRTKEIVGRANPSMPSRGDMEPILKEMGQ